MHGIISGHAPGNLRDRFCELAEDRGYQHSPEWSALCGRLWNCTDVMPSEFCAELNLPSGSSYASAARHLREWWGRSGH